MNNDVLRSDMESLKERYQELERNVATTFENSYIYSTDVSNFGTKLKELITDIDKYKEKVKNIITKYNNSLYKNTINSLEKVEELANSYKLSEGYHALYVTSKEVFLEKQTEYNTNLSNFQTLISDIDHDLKLNVVTKSDYNRLKKSMGYGDYGKYSDALAAKHHLNELEATYDSRSQVISSKITEATSLIKNLESLLIEYLHVV